jgi:hypothetical protein
MPAVDRHRAAWHASLVIIRLFSSLYEVVRYSAGETNDHVAASGR